MGRETGDLYQERKSGTVEKGAEVKLLWATVVRTPLRSWVLQ